MAPTKKIKTYNRSNRSLVNNSVDAGKVLFHRNKPESRKKRRLLIKELPPRVNGQTLLAQDSFHVSTEDTFDKLVKGKNYNPVNIKSNISLVASSLSESDLSNSIIKINKFYSPIMTRRKKKFASVIEVSSSTNISIKTSNSTNTSNKENTKGNNKTDSLLRRLKEPTLDKIDFSLEIERVQKPAPNSMSRIIIPEIKQGDMSINTLADNPSSNTIDMPFEPIFTKSFRERQLFHSSTPLVPTKSNKISNYTVSPIRDISSVENCVLISNNYSSSPSKLPNYQKFQERDVLNVVQSPLLPERQTGTMSRKSFITLRKRKVLKNSFIQATNKTVRKPKHDTENFKSVEQENVGFNEKINEEKELKAATIHNLRDFELFEARNKDLLIDSANVMEDTPMKFVIKRRRKLTDSVLAKRKKQKIRDSDFNEGNSKRLSFQKDCVVPEINISHCISADALSDTSIELETSSSESYGIPDNDFFRLKNPVFKNLAVDLTRQAFDQQNSSLEICRTNSSIESLRDESKSLFNNCDSESRCQTINSTELVNCSLIDQKEILNLIKKSIGSNISSQENKSASMEMNNVAIQHNGDYIQPNNKNCENRVSKSKEDNDHVSAENFEEIFRSAAKRSQSSKRSETQTSGYSKRFSSDLFDDEYLNRQLVVNLTRSPWNKNMRRSTTTTRSGSKDTVIDLTDSFVEKDIRKSSSIHNISSVIESSVLESSQVDRDGFKIPFVNNPKRCQSKALVLKAGKLWRRSLSMYKRSSIQSDFNEDSCLLSGNLCRCPKCNLARQSASLSNRRLSIRIVPAKTSSGSQREVSVLENYAHNASYVSDRILEDNLENDLRSLSLSKKLSIVQNSAPVTARELVLKRCEQEEPLPFEECYPKSVLQNCQKIGEGVYGEVFLFKNPNGGTSVIKVIPIEGDLIVNGERQKKFEEILSEITIALELSNMRNNKENKTSGFAEVQKVCCVQGCYPEKLLDLWDLYDETRGSENDSPEIFGEDQLYIVLQLANAGSDLEAFVFNNALQAYTMFQQVACTLAVAEEELRFEHRDLHWGNVLLSVVDKKSNVTFRLDGKNYDIMTKGVAVSIIDFTLSRIECDGVVIFNDLSLDPELFTAEGDYQFEIYKLMQKKNGNNWQRFEPYSNILWLHYTLDKAVAALRYKNTQTKVHKEYLGKLRQLKDEILNYNSVKEFVSDNF